MPRDRGPSHNAEAIVGDWRRSLPHLRTIHARSACCPPCRWTGSAVAAHLHPRRPLTRYVPTRRICHRMAHRLRYAGKSTPHSGRPRRGTRNRALDCRHLGGYGSRVRQLGHRAHRRQRSDCTPPWVPCRNHSLVVAASVVHSSFPTSTCSLTSGHLTRELRIARGFAACSYLIPL
jgi:hypothetical protein